MARTKPWTVSDEFWEKVEPLVPPAPSHAKGGRTRMDDRKAFAAIVYVLRTGIQWNALPRELGASSTVHDRFQEWERAGFFEELWGAGLAEYDEREGIEWEWQAIEGANCHDAKLLMATLKDLVVARPAWEEEDEQQHMCLDAAYDSKPVREELKERGYVPHIRPADKKQKEREGAVHRHGGRARRWVVERTRSWLNRSRRLLVPKLGVLRAHALVLALQRLQPLGQPLQS